MFDLEISEKIVSQDFDILQDLSQPKSEASPPDGVLSVSLLKHQVHMSLDLHILLVYYFA